MVHYLHLLLLYYTYVVYTSRITIVDYYEDEDFYSTIVCCHLPH